MKNNYYETQPKRWKDLSIREKHALIAAGLAFILGWTLTTLGFFEDPRGEVSNSVLFILGQALVFAASTYGIVNYIGSQHRAMKNDIQDNFNAMQQMMIQMDKFEEKYELKDEGSTQDNTR